MITILDYGMGNLASIRNMIKKVGGKSQISSDPNAIIDADALILPGVGHFGNAMKLIKEKGFDVLLKKKVIEQKTPILGICLGMQLLLEKSEEGNATGLGWIEGEVRKFSFENKEIKVPHMGWTSVVQDQKNPLFKGYTEELRFYFVHSYYVHCKKEENIIGKSYYGIDFTCAVNSGNIYGVQFHPEKSHKFGMQMMKNFIEIAES